MRADQVLIEHHDVLRALCKEITHTPAGPPNARSVSTT